MGNRCTRLTLDIPAEGIAEARRTRGFNSIVSLEELFRRRRIEELRGLLGKVRLKVDIPVSRRRQQRSRPRERTATTPA